MRVKLLFLAVLLGLNGCGDADKAAQSAEQKAAQAAVVQKPYRVVETFNVGDGVYVRSLAIDHKANTLWVGTSVGVLEVDMATRDVRNTFTRENGMANEYVFAMFVDSQGNKWFGTDGGGLSRYKDGQWKTFFPMHGLADYWVYSFAEQKNGTLWVGTWAGLNSIDAKSGAFTTYLEELVNEWVYGLAIDSKDRVWVGTEGGVNLFDGKTWKSWTHKDGLGAANKAGLPASANTGLGTRSRHDLTVIAQGLPTYNPNYVFDIEVAADDTVWAGTWGGGVGHFDGQHWTNYTTSEGLGGDIVYSIAREKSGVLWFGTNQGVSRYDGKNWQTFASDVGLLDNNVYALAVDGKGGVWVGTRNGVALLAN